jgi:hypothetical protein
MMPGATGTQNGNTGDISILNCNDRIPEPKENPIRAICSFSGHKKFKYIIKTSSNG